MILSYNKSHIFSPSENTVLPVTNHINHKTVNQQMTLQLTPSSQNYLSFPYQNHKSLTDDTKQ